MPLFLLRLILSWTLLCCFMVRPALAHDPFDGSLHLSVQRDTIEVSVTFGTDAARAWLAGSGVSRPDIVSITRGSDQAWIALPLPAAARLVTLQAGDEPLTPTHFAAAPSEIEPTFRLVYARPAGDAMRLRARYFEHIADMRAGALTAVDPGRHILSTSILSREQPAVTLSLSGRAGPGARMLDYFKLGVEHILIGYDHLLFLAALLIGVSALRPMLWIVTCFTLGHSLTLGMAALGVLAPPASVVEPMIAASIIVVGLDNLLRKESATGSAVLRYWVAAGFGLIHGFGFAGILRERALADGGHILLPLLGFNLGVEAGQLLVATLLVPVLIVLRRRVWFERRGAPVLSLLVIGISSMWLAERVG